MASCIYSTIRTQPTWLLAELLPDTDLTKPLAPLAYLA